MDIFEIAKYATAIVAIIGALTGVGAPMIKLLKKIRDEKKATNEILSSLDKMLKSLDERMQIVERHSHEDFKNILRLIIMNDDMPISERISAGDKYIEEGGNGAVKAKYKALIKEYEETEINGYNNI